MIKDLKSQYVLVCLIKKKDRVCAVSQFWSVWGYVCRDFEGQKVFKVFDRVLGVYRVVSYS